MRGTVLERVHDGRADVLSASSDLFLPEAATEAEAEIRTPIKKALLVTELPEFARSYERYAKLLGSVALAQTVEAAPRAPAPSLLEAIRKTLEGSTEAASLVDINVGSTASEACFKKDHVTQIAMHINEANELMQFGQTMAQFQYNSLALRPKRHEKLEAVTRKEALHGHCIEDLAVSGMLDEYWYVVSSLVPQDVPEEDLGEKGDGYFLNSLTFVNQASTREGNEVITASAFSAGVEADEDASFAERIAQRHDIAAISRVRQRLGLPPISTTEEALEGILVHKSLMPNGVVDFMRMCDEEADAILGRTIVRNDAHYTTLLAESIAREESLADTKKQIKQELLERVDELHEPMDAINLLWELTRQYSVRSAATNLHIDPIVFGAEAVASVEESRYRISIGDFIGAERAIREALEVAVVSGCGGGSSAEKESKDEDVQESIRATDSIAQEKEGAPETWKWRKGICRVAVCPTRPGKTMIGPCDVCRRCQAVFDRGADPTKLRAIRKTTIKQNSALVT